MVVSNNYSSCDDKSVQMKPVRVLLQNILRKSQEGTTADMVAMLPETIVQNCDIKSLEDAKKPYTCSLCNKSFTQNDTMIIHMQTHTKEKPFTCSLCSKPFSTKSNLTKHLRIHTGEKPFSCMICKKLFSQSSEVKSHMRIHTGDKPFSCMICNKLFAQKSQMKSHMQTHTGEKLFACSHCNKSYALRYSLKMHLMSHTSKKPHSDVMEESKVLPKNVFGVPKKFKTKQQTAMLKLNKSPRKIKQHLHVQFV